MLGKVVAKMSCKAEAMRLVVAAEGFDLECCMIPGSQWSITDGKTTTRMNLVRRENNGMIMEQCSAGLCRSLQSAMAVQYIS
jgi:hypothetical protein